MATEYKLSYTASEINRKLATVDETANTLESSYYTSADIDTKLEEVNTSIDDIETGLQAKADLVDGKIPTEQLPDDIGGGASSWNDLEDKPFYDTRVGSYYSQAENPNPVSFDNSMVGYSFYKVSDLIPTRDEIFNSIKVIVNDSVCKPKESEIQLETDDFIMLVLNNNQYAFIFINKAGTLSFTYQGYQMTLEAPEAGIYHVLPIGTSIPSGRIIEIILSGELKTLDLKYLPENMALGYEKKTLEDIVWDGNTDGLVSTSQDIDVGEGMIATYAYYKVSDKFISAATANNAIMTMVTPEGEDVDTLSLDYMMIIDTGSWMDTYSSLIVSCAEPNDTFVLGDMGMSFTFSEVGTYFLLILMGGEYMGRAVSLTGSATIKTIDEKFIPDAIARKSDLNNIDLSNYYTKSETYTRYEVDNKISNVTVDLSGYYTKNETYNKTEVDSAINGIDLSNYYTKTEIDEITGDINTVLDEINALIGE